MQQLRADKDFLWHKDQTDTTKENIKKACATVIPQVLEKLQLVDFVRMIFAQLWTFGPPKR
jgi:hypothetical protein